MSAAVQRVVQALAQAGVEAEVRSFPAGTRTAQDAAAAVGVEVGQIVKSLVFTRPESGRALLVLVSGANRADERLLADEAGEPVARADADFVRRVTGFSIGGVPPVGHAEALDTLIDEDLLRFACVWAAAGTPTDVFAIAPDDLVRATGGSVVAVRPAGGSSAGRSS
jgi:prolyl-tRNA editing enzyme YbaK/EbsC (Cys-tRNA(Pro) deacylase)